MAVFIDALGTVTPVATVNVYSQVSGRVMSVEYREGQMVEEGQVLAKIDSRPTEAQLAQARGALARDRAALEQSKTNLKRYQDAYKERAISAQTVYDQQATLNQNEGTVSNDEATVRYYEVQLDYCTIRAPIGGRIGLRLVDAGNTIFSGSSTVVATITQIDPITVVFSVAEDHLPKLNLSQDGKAAVVELYDRTLTKKLAEGALSAIDNQVDTATGTLRLRAQFENKNGKLFPNQFVNARLQVDKITDAKLIPTVAIQYNGQQAFVYTIGADKKVTLHNITVLNSEGERSAITDLNAGDTVVTSNFDRLTDGATVNVGPSPGAPNGMHGQPPK